MYITWYALLCLLLYKYFLNLYVDVANALLVKYFRYFYAFNIVVPNTAGPHVIILLPLPHHCIVAIQYNLSLASVTSLYRS